MQEYPAQPAVLSSTASFGDWLLLTAHHKAGVLPAFIRLKGLRNPNAGTPWKMWSLEKFQHISPGACRRGERQTRKRLALGIKETILENLTYRLPPHRLTFNTVKSHCH